MIIVLFSTLHSCKPNGKEKNDIDKSDTLQTTIVKKEQERLAKRRKIEEQYYADSLRLDKVLQDALKIAYQHINKDKFVEKFEVSDENGLIGVEMDLNYHFTKTTSHLIIRRTNANTVDIDIYSKNNGKYEKVLSHEQWNLTYVSDTIRDINGDGLNDFVVNWYGACGCCLKGFSNVYLMRQDNKSFSESFEFINPTFSPKEKIIRGVCYGHPGETELYKYKWNGEQIDTLEYVSFEKNEKGEKTGKILITTNRPSNGMFKILKVLNEVPAEYNKIDGYDWFTGEF